jgi:hypothetical protein
VAHETRAYDDRVILTRLRRHPLPIRSEFELTLVLTYALPAPVLEPLLLPGLTLDRFGDVGFVAVALVQTRNLRPAFLPKQLGLDFFLGGYRIFTRYRTEGRELRGLQILRSQTDSRIMTFFGNLLTHYNYRRAAVEVTKSEERLAIAIHGTEPHSDLEVVANLAEETTLPATSVFSDWKTARRFAGPLPFTFDHEAETNSIVRIEGVRQKWMPRPVNVDVKRMDFFGQPAFASATPLLASAFYLADVPYLWRQGVLAPLDEEERAHG